MPDLTSIPLEQLLKECPPLTQRLTAAADSAWHELLQRALVDQNDAAWDALINCLWFPIFAWLYAQAPNLPPAGAERMAQQVLLALRRDAVGATAAPHLTTAATLVQFLQEQISLVLAGKNTVT